MGRLTHRTNRGGLSGPIFEPGSLAFYQNAAFEAQDDYAVLLELPPDFGVGEFTFECDILLDDTLPYGATGGTSLVNWTSEDNEPYSNSEWWYEGNYLLDGHNNNNPSNGTFSLQVVGSGRIRWTFGDGAAAAGRTGGLHAVQAYPSSGASSVRDGNWARIACVRRWDSGSGAILELWVRGQRVAMETTTARTNMQTYWGSWSGYPGGEEGWFLGAEKRSATGAGAFWDDFKGRITNLRFFNFAKSESLLAQNYQQPLHADANVAGHYKCDAIDGLGRTYDAVSGTRYIQCFPQSGAPTSADVPPAPATTSMETTVAGMSDNSFASFAGGGLNTSSSHPVRGTTVTPLRDGKTNSEAHMTGFSGKGVYDPVNRRVLLMGCGYSTGDTQNDGAGAYQWNTRAIYSLAANTWFAERAFIAPSESTSAQAIGHTYDGNCIDVVGRRMFKARSYGNIYVYDLDSGRMLSSIDLPAGISSATRVSGLEFIPTRGPNGALWLLSHNSSNQLVCWELQLGGSWSVLFSNSQLANEGNTSLGPSISYNPRADSGNGGVMMGGATAQWLVTNLGNSTPTINAIAQPGGRRLDCANGESSGFCRDPRGDGWLKFSQVTGFTYQWSGGSWTQRAALPAAINWDFFVVPIDELGVVWLVNYDAATAFQANAQLYRPAAP